MQFTASQIAILSLFLSVSSALPQQYSPDTHSKGSPASKVEASYSSAKGAYPTAPPAGQYPGGEGPNAYMSEIRSAMSVFESKWASLGAGYATPIRSHLTPGCTPTPGTYNIPKGAPKAYVSEVESLVSQYEHALPTGGYGGGKGGVPKHHKGHHTPHHTPATTPCETPFPHHTGKPHHTPGAPYHSQGGPSHTPEHPKPSKTEGGGYGGKPSETKSVESKSEGYGGKPTETKSVENKSQGYGSQPSETKTQEYHPQAQETGSPY